MGCDCQRRDRNGNLESSAAASRPSPPTRAQRPQKIALETSESEVRSVARSFAPNCFHFRQARPLGYRPGDRKQQGGGLREKRLLLRVVDLTDEPDRLAVDVGLELLLK
jgi:hypothetical protein